MTLRRVQADKVLDDFRASGFHRAEIIDGDSYEDLSTILLMPTRGGKPKDYIRPDGEPAEHVGMIPDMVHNALITLVKPPNHRFCSITVRGEEVSRAYNKGILHILEDPLYSKFRFVLTVEDDNIIPSHALIALQDAIRRGPYDAVSGVYFMKGSLAIPMAFGRPGVIGGDGLMDFTPRDLSEAIMASRTGDDEAAIVEVNGIACGCTLWNLDLFRELETPEGWFKTWTKFHSDVGVTEVLTQDIYFCRKAREKGKRFAVDCRVRVGHLDVQDGTIY